jgi:uncharacterized protein YndB with AHSA1/START domain
MHDEHTLEPVRRSVEVGCSAAEAFRLFTEEIDSWWPLATHSIGLAEAQACFFEGRDGGRIYESHGDGSISLWGTVTVWEPPERVVFSWHPGRDASTAQEVELRFTQIADGTRVELEHRGWEILGETADEIRSAYESGWVGVLDRYAAHCA